MILLDTNVLSELMRERADGHVVDWLRAQVLESLFTTALSEAELRAGVAILPSSKRRNALEQMVTEILRGFAGRILPFDSDAAGHYALVLEQRRRAGHPIGPVDGQIAAIARTHGARLATRNVGDFEGCGVELVNPWARE